MSADRSDLSTLLSSASLVVLGVVVASVAKLVERIVVGRTFGPGRYGEVSIGLAVLGLSVTVSVLGFNHGVPRYVSRMDDERDRRGVWASGLVVAVLASLLVAGVLYANVERVAALLFDTPESPALVRLFVLAIPFVVGLRVGVSAIRGMENTVYKTYVADLLYPGLRIGVLVALVLSGYGILSVGYAYLVAAAVTVVAAHVLVNRLFSLVGPVRTHVRRLLTFSTPLIVATLLSMLLTRTDTIMLGFFRDSAEAGLYGAAYPLANGLLLALSAFGYLYLPLTSRLDADGKTDEVESIYEITTKWTFVLTFPPFLLFVAFPGDVVATIFDQSYRSAGPALAILSLGFFTSAALGRNRETLSALGNVRSIMFADLLAFGVNLAANLVLIPAYGFVGAAVASAGSFALRNLALNAVLFVRHGITPVSRSLVRAAVALPVVLVPPAVLAARRVSLTGVTFLPALGLVALATLAVVALAGGLEADDAAVVELFEEATGRELPRVRAWIPEEGPG